jgi:hypothetical protein
MIGSATAIEVNAKVIIPDEITGSANSHEIDLTSYGTISSTWGYVYVN